MQEIPKAYNPQETEDKIYKKWEDSGYFNPDNLPGKRPDYFSISMPPPNATGTLHTGHAIMLAYEDLMVRYNRLLGKKTLWLPGTDHASIATQAKVEKILYDQEKKTRHDLGREEFLIRVENYVAQSRDTIRNQIRKMGSSCDWSRERYTLDEGLSQTVRYAFVKMYEAGVIYRGYRIVNWCPHCLSTLSDDEVEYKETAGKFYTFKYGKDFPMSISTTRPETKLGDTAVAVNPNDKRYKKYIGQTLTVDFGAQESLQLKIIADESVDPKFGTGALGVTPAHSKIDFDMAQKNNLPVIKVINEEGRMTKEAGKEYEGLTVLEARQKLVDWLEKQGLLVKVEEVPQNLTVCYRCGATIEPLPSLQWFVDVNKKVTLADNKYFKNKSIKEVALQVVKDKEIKIIPERFESDYYYWLEKLHDWCISRQIWFGHQIPVWYKASSAKASKAENKGKDNEEVFVGLEAPKEADWVQDPDTLDTWFSSGLWTFSTLMDIDYAKYKNWGDWLKNSKDLNFHPTSVMETGYDILFFWVARMIIQTTFIMGEIPFAKVYLHGMVRTDTGEKMSKSLGNVVDPLDIIPKYGTDALRLAMISGTGAGADMRLYDEKFAGSRNFINKLWNISRYILTSVAEVKRINKKPKAKTLADEWILAAFEQTVTKTTAALNNFDFSAASELLRQFTWNDFADWYLEISKLQAQSPKLKTNTEEILLYILERLLILWHPFIPFVTEAIWENWGEDLLMVQSWPIFEKKIKEVKDFNLIVEIISIVRNLRAENKIEPAKKVNVKIFAGKQEKLITEQAEMIKGLVRIENLEILNKGEKPTQSLAGVVSGIEIYILLEGLIDTVKETERLSKEIEQIKNYIVTLEKKLSNQEFVKNAPKEVVAKENEKLEVQKEKLEKLEEQLKFL
ncbi:MAG: valine--tRNA ligase [Candidatus Buchananbacteria bacterium RBG_13_39_9]|uniref:Valine--tRNA ligase n=1 Tax=Candidatus Buchananbacteria bacterium RBG_13_39_9 TaxID=1797531 RepID=A0A1G1XRM4_9BACT|nr:MAG: valine--tRNA ligase [Candidatus Buchananbacteria bacterium RBG_13_39_9]